MSNLWPNERAEAAESLGSFIFERHVPTFTPWGSGDDSLDPAGDSVRVPDLEAAQAEAFAQGFESGRRTVEQEAAAERDAIARLAETLEALQPEPTQLLAALLAETVDRLVREIVGSVEVDQTLLIQRAEAAAALIGEETEPRALRVHPDDAALLEGAHIPVEVVADASLTRGTVLLETGQGWIEDGPAVRLDRLRNALDQMGAPR
jgi:flagellar assembly protein FliH